MTSLAGTNLKTVIQRKKRPKVAEKITDLIGNTPLISLNKLGKGLPGNVIGKLEFFNPCSSVKDRIGLSMIEDSEKKGILKPGSTIVEPTSGNTGVGLSYVAASKGYKLIITMPETMSIERRKLLEAFGTRVILTPGEQGMTGAVNKARELIARNPEYTLLQQFENEANPEAHRQGTALEIWEDLQGEIDILVCGVGTGGSITGISEVLKKLNPEMQSIAIEPTDSAVLSGGKPGPHKIQGIGAGFVPKILNESIIDEIIKVSNDEASQTARDLALKEGILSGISSGAAVFGALKVAKRKKNRGKNIVVILPDTGERYFSVGLFDKA
ncbi:MAG: cysteine synthase A [Bdellovibrionota bacterium]|nr:cysteine synthase A [Bdellovibrionota bacterium]